MLAIKKTISTKAKQALQNKLFSGVEILLAAKGSILFHQTYGKASSLKKTPLNKNSVFDLASITKILATSLAVMKLKEKKELSLQTKVAKFFKEFSVSSKQEITIFHLLTHSSGLPAWLDLAKQSKDSNLAWQQLLDCPLENKVGAVVNYSCLGFIILSKIISLVSGQNFKEFCQQNFYDPLELKNTSFSPVSNSNLVATSYDETSKQYLTGIVQDSNSRLFNAASGNAGLFSTATDVYKICQALLDSKNNLNNLLHPNSIKAMWQNQTPNKNFSWGLGWTYFSGKPEYCHLPNKMPKGMIGHLGFTGTSCFIDPVNEAIFLIFSNRVHYHNTTSLAKMKNFRLTINQLLYNQLLVQS